MGKWLPPGRGGYNARSHSRKPGDPFRQRAHDVTEATMPLVLVAWIAVVTLDAARDLADGIDGVVDVLALVIVVCAAVLAVMFGSLAWRVWRRRSGS